MSWTAQPSPDASMVDVASAVLAAAREEAKERGISDAAVSEIWRSSGLSRAAAELVPPERPRVAIDPEDPVGWSIGAAHQSSESRAERKKRGAFYTPAPVAKGLVRVAWEGRNDPTIPRWCDPTCGAGSFLLAAAEAMIERGVPPGKIGAALYGFDVDPTAVMAARMSLALWLECHGGDPLSPSISVWDAIHDDSAPEMYAGFDLIVGNPPFLGQLRDRSSRTPDQRTALDKRRGYADASSVMLERAIGWLSDHGRVVLIQPRSVLAARDSAQLRESAGKLSGLWVGGDGLFDAHVRVCAPVIDKTQVATAGSEGVATERRPTVIYGGPAVERVGESVSASWSGVLADAEGVPHCGSFEGHAHLRDIARITGDFRDWFYALAEVVGEAETIEDPVALLTSGLIDPIRSLWGTRRARVAGTAYLQPSVSAQVLVEDLDAAGRLVPKVLIANQTRAIEAFVDATGSVVPITPVISAIPHDQNDLWRVAAVLCSPVATAVAHHSSAGSGLSRGAVRLSAALLSELPLPSTSPDAWETAAEEIRDAVTGGAGSAAGQPEDASLRRSALIRAGQMMLAAYGIVESDPLEVELLRWWTERLPASGR